MSKRSPLFLTLLLVVLLDWLFFDRPFGWTPALFLTALLGAVVARYGIATRTDVVALAAIATLIAPLVLEPGAIAISLAIGGVVSLALARSSGWSNVPRRWIGRWLQFVLTAWTKLPLHAWKGRDQLGISEVGRTAAGGIKGWLMPVLMTLVFLSLFALANPVIDLGLENLRIGLVDVAGLIPDLLEPARIFSWIVGACWLFAVLALTTRDDFRSKSERVPSSPPTGISTTTVVRSLELFNGVFALQNVLDLGYLWGGAELPEGMSYAEYAHRGAYPLVATALLAGAFTLIAFRPGTASAASPHARGLVVVWIAQNLLLLVSATWRLNLYVEVYSLTRFRLSAAAWMLLVAIGLVTTVLRIMRNRSNLWLIKLNAAACLVVLYSFAAVDTDGVIARFNVQHSREMGGPGPPIDLAYLVRLGPSALPALDVLEAALRGTDRGHVVRQKRRYLDGVVARQLRDWRGWTVRRQRLSQRDAARARTETRFARNSSESSSASRAGTAGSADR